MQMPAANDTIIAASTAWHPSAVGVIRLSGPAGFDLVRRINAPPPADSPSANPVWTEARLLIDDELLLPADLLWFRAPKSYTGQDLVEIHTVGCLPALRALCARLIELGARRALPGEFTARAYLAGKLDPHEVEGVLSLIRASDESAARRAARLNGGAVRRLTQDLRHRIVDLLALIEAGIDFIEEEDVRFITPPEICRALDAMSESLRSFETRPRRDDRAREPHVAIVGLPNAGKSTLFNALLGYTRAIVAPVLGTTRDVLTAEVEIEGVTLVLQDCAGLGRTDDEIELAAHVAAERAADRADLVLWVHDKTAPWDQAEEQACRRIPAPRMILVQTKADLESRERPDPAGLDFVETVEVCAPTASGLEKLRGALVQTLAVNANGETGFVATGRFAEAKQALERAAEIASEDLSDLQAPEIIALELRNAHEQLDPRSGAPLVEDVLGRIFSQFCVGK